MTLIIWLIGFSIASSLSFADNADSVDMLDAAQCKQKIRVPGMDASDMATVKCPMYRPIPKSVEPELEEGAAKDALDQDHAIESTVDNNIEGEELEQPLTPINRIKKCGSIIKVSCPVCIKAPCPCTKMAVPKC